MLLCHDKTAFLSRISLSLFFQIYRKTTDRDQDLQDSFYALNVLMLGPQAPVKKLLVFSKLQLKIEFECQNLIMKQNFLHWDFAEGDKGNASLSVHGGGNFVEQNEFLFIVLTAAKEVQEKKDRSKESLLNKV